MNETFICFHCGQERPVTERVVFDGQELCQDCLWSQTGLCVYCGTRIWTKDDCGGPDHTVCHRCAATHYSRRYDECWPQKSSAHNHIFRFTVALAHIVLKVKLKLTISI